MSSNRRPCPFVDNFIRGLLLFRSRSSSIQPNDLNILNFSILLKFHEPPEFGRIAVGEFEIVALVSCAGFIGRANASSGNR